MSSPYHGRTRPERRRSRASLPLCLPGRGVLAYLKPEPLASARFDPSTSRVALLERFERPKIVVVEHPGTACYRATPWNGLLSGYVRKTVIADAHLTRVRDGLKPS